MARGELATMLTHVANAAAPPSAFSQTDVRHPCSHPQAGLTATTPDCRSALHSAAFARHMALGRSACIDRALTLLGRREKLSVGHRSLLPPSRSNPPPNADQQVHRRSGWLQPYDRPEDITIRLSSLLLQLNLLAFAKSDSGKAFTRISSRRSRQAARIPHKYERGIWQWTRRLTV